MADTTLSLVPDEVREPPAIPDDWDFDESVGRIQQVVYKWKNLTSEIASELWVAREVTSQRGGKHEGRWGAYCESIGVDRKTIWRWLDKVFPIGTFAPLAGTNGAHVGYATGESEWYTPAEYIEAARAVMGGVDLDPATVVVANDVVGAARIYTLAEDGLTKPWEGRVWMNPPYAQPAVMEFCEKLARHYSEGDVTEACVMVNNATETRWFHVLIPIASAICFPLGRIKFWHPDRESAPLQGQAIIYIGANGDRFREAFKSFGFTVAL